MNVVEGDRASDQSIRPMPAVFTASPAIVFTDVDDTLTSDGKLPVETFSALYRLQRAGIQVIPVTGASAGWCDCLIKTWPIEHIIGENGAITMSKNEGGVVSTFFAKNKHDIERDLARLMSLGDSLSDVYPEIRYTQDQKFRLTDIAFDIGQTVVVDESIVSHAVQWLLAEGVQARRSSIHINAWIGEHSKASGALHWLNQRNMNVEDCLFIGDSPNDEPMFEQFPLSVGVANIHPFIEEMSHLPAYVTENPGGYGFVEMVNRLIGTHA